MVIAEQDDKGTSALTRLYFLPPCLLSLSRFHRPWEEAKGVSSVKKRWARKFFSLLWRRYKLLSCDTFKEPEAASFSDFGASLTLFRHPPTVTAAVWGRGCRREDDDEECLRQCVLETTRSRHMDEDSDGASDSHCESRSLKQTKKRINLVIQSVGFFCTISWTRLTRRFDSVYQEEVVHVTIFTFS